MQRRLNPLQARHSCSDTTRRRHGRAPLQTARRFSVRLVLATPAPGRTSVRLRVPGSRVTGHGPAMSAPKKFTPVTLPWHLRLEARVASALGLLVAVALGAVLLVTLGLVSAQSRDRVAAELVVSRTAIYTLLEQRIASAIGEANLVTQLPAVRTPLVDPTLARDRRAMNALAEVQRKRMSADFTILAFPDGTWIGSAGSDDPSGSGRNVVRDAQHAARGGRATGAMVQFGPRLFVVVSVPARIGEDDRRHVDRRLPAHRPDGHRAGPAGALRDGAGGQQRDRRGEPAQGRRRRQRRAAAGLDGRARREARHRRPGRPPVHRGGLPGAARGARR